MQTTLAEAVSLIAQFLASLYERQDLQGHLECYHPDAWVLLGSRIARRSDLSAATYESHVASLLALAPMGPPPAFFEVAGDGNLKISGDEGLLRLSMRDRTQDRLFEACFHLRKHGDAWLLLGCALSTFGPPLTLETLNAAVAAELAQAALIPEPGELLFTPLHLAYRRAFPVGEPLLLALPESRFTCQNSGQCCRATWGVTLPEVAWQALGSVDWQDFDPRLKLPYFAPVEEGNYRIAEVAGTCSFHQDDGCVIHRTLGYHPLRICASFPVGFTATPEGICLWTSFFCPSVQSNLGELLSERHADMGRRVRLEHPSMYTVPAMVVLRPGGVAIPYGLYRPFEEGVLELLLDASLSPRERVQRALSGSYMLAEGYEGIDAAAAYALASQASPLEGEPVMTSFGISLFDMTLAALLQRHVGPAIAGLSGVEVVLLAGRIRESGISYAYDEDLLHRYLRQVLFRKTLLAQRGVLAQVKMLAWVEGLVRFIAMALASARGSDVTRDSDLSEAIRAVEQATVHSQHLAMALWDDPEFGPLFDSRRSGIMP